MSGGNIEFGSLSKSFRKLGAQLSKYRIALFFLLAIAIYGFIAFRITSLAGIAPDESAVPETTKATRAHIDEEVAKKIQELQDNSVNVQKAFDEARNNPFKE